MMKDQKKILIVNPPVFTPKPYYESDLISMAPYVLASHLKHQGRECHVFDFIEDRSRLCGHQNDRTHRVAQCGNFKDELISKPIRYVGRHEKFYIEYLKGYNPTEVWISSLFTYNWEASKFVTDLTRNFNKDIYIKLGGVYASLCCEHAKNNIDIDEISVADCNDPIRFTKININLYKSFPTTFSILTSFGCPFNCAWCAVPSLEGHKMKFRNPIEVVDDIEEKYLLGVKQIRFMDSNLLANYDNHFKIILQELIKRKIKVILCSYGGINPLYVNQEMLELMKEAGFLNIQLPLETIDGDLIRENNRQLIPEKWAQTISCLKRIKGFSVSSYLLCGLPGQKTSDIYRSMAFIKDYGAEPRPLFFTPIPGTKYEDKTKRLEDLHPYLFPYASNDMKVKDLEQILVNSYTKGCHIPEYIEGEKHTSSPAILKEGRNVRTTIDA